MHTSHEVMGLPLQIAVTSLSALCSKILLRCNLKVTTGNNSERPLALLSSPVDGSLRPPPIRLVRLNTKKGNSISRLGMKPLLPRSCPISLTDTSSTHLCPSVCTGEYGGDLRSDQQGLLLRLWVSGLGVNRSGKD